MRFQSISASQGKDFQAILLQLSYKRWEKSLRRDLPPSFFKCTFFNLVNVLQVYVLQLAHILAPQLLPCYKKPTAGCCYNSVGSSFTRHRDSFRWFHPLKSKSLQSRVRFEDKGHRDFIVVEGMPEYLFLVESYREHMLVQESMQRIAAFQSLSSMGRIWSLHMTSATQLTSSWRPPWQMERSIRFCLGLWAPTSLLCKLGKSWGADLTSLVIINMYSKEDFYFDYVWHQYDASCL